MFLRLLQITTGILFVVLAGLLTSIVFDWPINVKELARPIKVSTQEADAIVNTSRYVKDRRTGLCYAVAYRRMTLVPCDKVEDYLGK